ncbi:MAG: histidinol-phosphatase [Bacteroidaceae bacterium]|nr:histidinol-phosphatase [Bacteroidaceae bacterium]
MRTNYHTHTFRCMHAVGSDEDYVESAICGGYKELGFSDHTPWLYETDYVADMRMTVEELPDYVNSLKELKDRYKDRISIKIGLECEYFENYITWLKEIVRKYDLDYIIFGNHFYKTDEQFPYFGRYTTTSEMLQLYEESILKGMESGLFAYVAHPDLFIRSYPQFDENCVNLSRKICKKARKMNIPLEYNVSGLEICKGNKEGYPHPTFWKIAADEGCLSIVGMDAHDNRCLENYALYDNAVKYLNKLGIRIVCNI